MIDASTILRIVLAFALIGVMLYSFAAIARRRMGTTLAFGRERLVSVIESTPLSQAGSLHVIKVGERYHVIALASGAISILTEIEPFVVERRAAAAANGRARLWAGRGSARPGTGS